MRLSVDSYTYTLSAQVYVKPTIACALAHRLPPKTTTSTRIPADLLPSPCGRVPTQNATAFCVGPGGGTGGGISLHTANAESPAESPLPCEAGEGWGGGVKKPRSNNTHSTVPFTYTTYTSPATLYVKLLLTLALLTAPAFAAPDFKPLETGGSYAQLYHQDVRYGIYQADPACVSLHWKDSDGSAYATLGTLKRHLEASGARVAFLMNAGIYSTDDTPAGLWIERGKTLIPLNRKAGKGNFHIQPNGVFYIERGKAHIQPTAAYHLGQHQPDWAVQSGPMLLMDGKPNARFVKNLSSPHKRNAVCTTKDDRLYFILTEDYNREGEWPSFHRFAEALQHLGCHDALYLDGTLSGWYIPGIAGTFHWTHYVGIIAVTTPEHP